MSQILVFAGGERQNQSLAGELPEPDLVVAADSGYDIAVQLGYRVDVLIGDLDSIERREVPGHVIVERHPADKDQSDLELALARVAEEQPDRVVVVGGSGGRLDHELVVAGLVTSRRWEMIGEIDWLSDRGWVHVLRGRRLLHADIGTTLSLIPAGGDAAGVTSKGLHWDLNDSTLYHGTSLGLSNRFERPVADITVGYGTLLAVIPGLQP